MCSGIIHNHMWPKSHCLTVVFYAWIGLTSKLFEKSLWHHHRHHHHVIIKRRPQPRMLKHNYINHIITCTTKMYFYSVSSFSKLITYTGRLTNHYIMVLKRGSTAPGCNLDHCVKSKCLQPCMCMMNGVIWLE